MPETRKLAAILVADIVGYSRLAGADEERTLCAPSGASQRSDRPGHRRHHDRIVKRAGDSWLVEFRSVVNAVRCTIEDQNGLIERNLAPPDRRIEFASASISGRGRGERRRFDGRRRQYRRAPRRHLRGGRDLPLRGRLLRLRGAVDADLGAPSRSRAVSRPAFGDDMFVSTATRWIDRRIRTRDSSPRRSSRAAQTRLARDPSRRRPTGSLWRWRPSRPPRARRRFSARRSAWSGTVPAAGSSRERLRHCNSTGLILDEGAAPDVAAADLAEAGDVPRISKP